MRRLAALSLALVSCGSSSKGGGPDAHPAIPDARPTPDVAIIPDAPPIPDASKLPDAMPTADAQMVDLSCVGASPATMAPDPVMISGIVQETAGLSQQPSMGTNVDFLMINETTSIMSTPTLTDGSYALSLPTSLQPLAGVGHLTKATFLDFWLYPPEPLFQDLTNVPGVMVSTSLTGFVAALFPGGFVNSFTNMVVVEVVDCSNHAIAGATVTLSIAPGKEAYAGTDYLPNTKLTMTSPAGLYEGLNVDSSAPVTATGMFGTTVLHGATSFNVHDGAITATIIHP